MTSTSFHKLLESLALLPPDRALKSLPVIADGHGEGEEFFEGLLGGGKVHGDLAGGEVDAGREVGEGLIHDGNRGGDGDAGLPGGAEIVESLGQPSSSPPLVGSGVAGGEPAQVFHKPFAVGHPARADLPSHARGEELLGAAAADAKQAFDGGTVDPGVGQGSELCQNLI